MLKPAADLSSKFLQEMEAKKMLKKQAEQREREEKRRLEIEVSR